MGMRLIVEADSAHFENSWNNVRHRLSGQDSTTFGSLGAHHPPGNGRMKVRANKVSNKGPRTTLKMDGADVG